MTPRSKSSKILDRNHNIYISGNNTLSVLMNKEYLDMGLFEHLSHKDSIQKVNIYLDSVKKLNKLCEQLKRSRGKEINILFAHVNAENNMDEVNGLQLDHELAKFDVEKLPANVKVCYKRVLDYDMSKHDLHIKNKKSLSLDTWILNASNKNLEKFIESLDEESKRYVLLEKSIIKTIYSCLKHTYNDLDEKSSIEKAQIVSEYVNRIIKDDNEDNLSSDPVSTYIRKRGNSQGKSRLVQILLNNKYLNVDCYCAKGCYNHYWNEIIDETDHIIEIDSYDEIMPIKELETVDKSRLILQHSIQVDEKNRS